MYTYDEFAGLLLHETNKDLIQDDRKSDVLQGIYRGLQLYFSQIKNQDVTLSDFVNEGIRALTLGYPYFVWCDKFSIEAYQLITAGLLHGINVAAFATVAYDDKQMLQIYLGELQGLDTSLYSDVRYSYEKMYIYRQLIKKGVDITRFLDTRFSYFHLDTIADCCDYNVDVTELLNPILSQEDVITISNRLIKEKWKT